MTYTVLDGRAFDSNATEAEIGELRQFVWIAAEPHFDASQVTEYTLQ
jgi:hypothetical protein